VSEDFPAHLSGFRPGSVLAGYRIEAHLAAGGMGVVFRARDLRLGRLVALKVLVPALAADPVFRRRFIAESRAAAAVDDPHIIPVYEADEADGVLFIAMRFVQGGDLRRVLEREGLLSPDRAAEFISPVASALDAAHAAGLIHRDVKPGNILVDTRAGRPDHVYLSDFGAVKGATSSVSLTQTGHFLGTPDYAAPEQVNGLTVDGRTDQYALACVTYQLLAGEPPFARDHGMAVLLAHLSAQQPSLTSRRPDLPGAADHVLARAMAKTPDERYESCGNFADALRDALGLAPYHYRGSGPLAVHPQHPVTSAAKNATSQATGSGTSADPPDLAGTVTIGSPGDGRREDGASSAAADPGPGNSGGIGAQQPAPDTLIPARLDATPPTPVAVAGHPAWIQRHRLLTIAVGCAAIVAAAVIPVILTIQPHAASPAHARNSANTSQAGHSAIPPSTILYSPAMILNSPDTDNKVVGSGPGGILAIGDGDGSVYLWDITVGKISATFPDPASDGAVAVAFEPGNASLAVADGNGRTYLWDVAARKISATLADPASRGVTSVAFSPGGTILAAGDGDGRTYLWDVATGKISATLADPASRGVTSVAFSPGGTILAAGDGDGRTYLWDVATGKISATLADPGSAGVNSVSFSPDGSALAAGDGGGRTYLWDVATGKISATLADPGSTGVNSVSFSPDGTALAAGDSGGRTYLWDVATGKISATLVDPSSQGVAAVTFTPAGDPLAVADDNGDTYVWDITS